ncbi:MAG: HAD-IIIA family hydrolase [Planctomycetota bacterium]
MRAVILAAGLGTRLKPLTDHTPKCLAPVAGRPLLDWWIDALAAAGVREALVNTHALADQVRRHLAAINARGGMRLTETHEPELLGSAGTIAANRSYADGADHVVIIYADNLSEVDLGAMLDFHRGHDDPVTMLLFHTAEPRSCGIAELDEADRVVAFTEKPEHPTSDLANAGVYVVDADVYRAIADRRVFDLGHDVLPSLVGSMRGWPLAGAHVDIGTPDRYERAQAAGRRMLADRGFDAEGRRAAVFLDRDGTLIIDRGYLDDPDGVSLLPGAAAAIRRLRRAGFACVVVTNQSAIGRGIITEARLGEIHEAMCGQLAAEGAVLDAIYHSPHVPRGSDRTVIEFDDRKPGPGMLRRAARELELDLGRSWMVGDFISDALAGVNAGCRGSLLLGGGGTDETGAAPAGVERIEDLETAAARILAGTDAAKDIATTGGRTA